MLSASGDKTFFSYQLKHSRGDKCHLSTSVAKTEYSTISECEEHSVQSCVRFLPSSVFVLSWLPVNLSKTQASMFCFHRLCQVKSNNSNIDIDILLLQPNHQSKCCIFTLLRVQISIYVMWDTVLKLWLGFRHKNHLVRIRKGSRFDFKSPLWPPQTRRQLSPGLLVAHSHSWRYPDFPSKISVSRKEILPKTIQRCHAHKCRKSSLLNTGSAAFLPPSHNDSSPRLW